MREATVFTAPPSNLIRRTLKAHWAVLGDQDECIALFLYKSDAEDYVAAKQREGITATLEEVRG